jgi:hypothetical protein
MMKSRWMRWTGSVAGTGEKKNASKLLEDQDVGGWIILRWILEREDGVVWTEFVCLELGPMEGSREHGNEPNGSIKCWDVLE